MLFDNLNPLGQFRPIMWLAGEGEGGGSGEGDGAGAGGGAGAGSGAGGGNQGFSWKGKLGVDLANSPLAQKFEDSEAGLNEAIKSYASLEKLLGHEKVPIPKGPEDTEGWNRFSKAMGIPAKATEYGLPDAQVPEGLKGVTFNKEKFAEIAHAHKLTPGQAKGLWEAYSNMVRETYNNSMNEHKSTMTEIVNRLRSEWGDAYDSNVQLGQLVINKFSGDQETEDFIMSSLAKDPRGIRFLAKIGSQFSENKIGEFAYQRFSLSPDEARVEMDKMIHDPDGPYMNQSGKFTEEEHQKAVDRYNSLLGVLSRAK